MLSLKIYQYHIYFLKGINNINLQKRYQRNRKSYWRCKGMSDLWFNLRKSMGSSNLNLLDLFWSFIINLCDFVIYYNARSDRYLTKFEFTIMIIYINHFIYLNQLIITDTCSIKKLEEQTFLLMNSISPQICFPNVFTNTHSHS